MKPENGDVGTDDLTTSGRKGWTSAGTFRI
jgi:hypothetical protein